jgi:hypothetical protein
MRTAANRGVEGVPDEPPGENFGVSAHLITTRVDVSSVAGTKRLAMRCHRSQISDTDFFLALEEKEFIAAFGTEEYIRRGAPAGTVETALDLSWTIGPLD